MRHSPPASGTPTHLHSHSSEGAALNDPQPNPTHAILFGPAGLRPGWGLLLFVFLYFATLALANTLTHSASSPHELTPAFVLRSEAKALLAVALATWVMSRIERRPANAYGLSGTRKLPHLLTGLASGAAFLSLLVLTLRSTGLLAFDARLLFGAAAARYGLLWLAGFLLVALLEETLFRGYLQLTLALGLTSIFRSLHAPHSDALGFWTAALLLSLLFGQGHGSNPGESPLGLIAALLAGLLFCLALWRTGSLWWAIGFHAAWDWAQSFLYGVADSGLVIQHRLVATHPTGNALLSGGTTGPEGSLYMLPTLALAALTLLALRRTSDTTDTTQ